MPDTFAPALALAPNGRLILPTPDPRAKRGTLANPWHQSNLQPPEIRAKFVPPGGGTWLATPTGTAYHAGMEALARGEQRLPAIEYLRAACAASRQPVHVSRRFASVEDAAAWVEAAWDATDELFPIRDARFRIIAAEPAFLWCDAETQEWYEGWIDLVVEIDGKLYVVDYKTGTALPDADSPQPDLYSWGVAAGWLAHAPKLGREHQCDWPNAVPLDPERWLTPGVPTIGRWPDAFAYVHVPGTVGIGAEWWHEKRRAPQAALKSIREATQAAREAAENPAPKASASGEARVRGMLLRVCFAKADSDWKILEFAVAQLPQGDGERIATVKGELAVPVVGAEYEIAGKWGEYKGREELKAFSFRPIRPSTPEAVERVLQNLSGFGPARARRAVEAFGADALDRITHDAEAVSDACKMPVATVEAAARELGAASAELETKAALISMLPHAHTRTINTIWRNLGENAIVEIERDPYILLGYRGIGWETADSVAGQRGITGDDSRRVRAGILATLTDAEADGHTLLPAVIFGERAQSLLNVSMKAIRRCAAEMVEAGIIHIERGDRAHVQRIKRRAEEIDIAERLYQIARSAFGVAVSSHPEIAERCRNADLTAEQADAVAGILHNGCGVLTGGPGTGKTHTLRVLLDCLSAKWKVVLAAPTGKAAKVLALVTGRPAKTIHSLLRPASGTNVAAGEWRFQHDAEEPLPYDVVIIDESSMIDHSLAAALLAAIPPHASLVFIGDADQLPSVGAGEFFGSLVRADLWPVFRLTQVHRNAGVGRRACAAIIRGEAPEFGDITKSSAEGGNNCWLVPMPAEEQPRMVERILAEWCPTKGFHPIFDVAVLSANSTRHGPVSAPALNEYLQKCLNAEGVDTGIKDPVADTTWRVGDRLMQTANVPEYELVNGDFLTLTAWDEKLKQATLRVDDGRELQLKSLKQALDLRLAYAATVHKWQGSQAPVVIVCLHGTAQAAVISRQWLYTAISRFRSYCFVLTDRPGDVARAIKKQADKRWTGLDKRLRGGIYA